MAPKSATAAAPVVPVAPSPAVPVKAGKAAAAPSAATPSAAPAKAPAKAAATKAAAPVAEPVVPVASPAAATETVDDAPVAPALETLEAKITGLLTLAKEAVAALKLAKKEVEKMKKVADKAERKRANARTSPSGFAKPAKITDDLCAFLGVPAGTEMSRTDVTRHINQYVKTHNLCKPENKKVILPNAALKKLLGCKDTDVVSYFNLQRWLKGHFIRPATA